MMNSMIRTLAVPVLAILCTASPALAQKGGSSSPMQPYHESRSSSANLGATVNFAVPEGKRLVIEHVSLWVRTPAWAPGVRCSVSVLKGGSVARHEIPTQVAYDSAPHLSRAASLPLKMYVDGGPVQVMCNAGVTVLVELDASIAGHLISAP